ncbi:MAG: aspartate aminotransferase family protein [Candidatus Latescibacteria bacterium]|jgi:acetylornithine/N-succinyldiaminopimelate aminotransferase|nr:aspartate aminotransferase family protein [Candidatus Latescibacterota bacterium]
MNTQEIIDLEQKYILQTYGRPEFVLEKGDGVHITDTDGKSYLDFVSGLSVNALGYNSQTIIDAATDQLGQLIHVSNLYHTIPAPQLAQLLCENSFADRVFFCNSGTESIEAALKFARKWGYKNFEDNPKNKIIAMNNSFHGRTYGGISATGQPKYHKGFGPMLPGIEFADLNDLESVEKLVDSQTVAVLLEPLQAEGGINSSDPAFLEGVRALCDEMKMLLIFDEIQCGLGRTGTLFCYEQYGVSPDIMTLAKPLAGGLPIGATLVTQNVADAVEPGDHAATFGAHPVSCAVAVEVFKTLSDSAFIAGVKEKSDYLFGKLDALKEKHSDKVTEIRGSGLIAGVVIKDIPAVDAMNAIREKNGILICIAGPDVVRFLPPLVIEKEHIDEAVNALDEFLAN